MNGWTAEFYLDEKQEMKISKPVGVQPLPQPTADELISYYNDNKHKWIMKAIDLECLLCGEKIRTIFDALNLSQYCPGDGLAEFDDDLLLADQNNFKDNEQNSLHPALQALVEGLEGSNYNAVPSPLVQGSPLQIEDLVLTGTLVSIK